MTLRTAHTADLDAGTLRAAHAMLEVVFEGELTDDDWEHALGGIHALVYEGEEIVGHAAVVQRRLVHGGRALRCGYVEAVGVSAAHRRRGHGAAVMEVAERVIRGAYDLGALGATDDGAALYTRRGWRRWEGPLSALTPKGIVRTPDEDGYVYVLPGELPLDLTGELTCDWRDGDVW
jgi:aminoglycoside 2'-N-acetyltransferase I